MADPKGFLLYQRKDNPLRPIMQRVKDLHAYTLDVRLETRRKQAARCILCGLHFCTTGVFYGGGRAVSGCPKHNHIPTTLDLVYRATHKRAFTRYSRSKLLPDNTGRVCPAPCTVSCVQALNGPGVTLRNNTK